ncbi:uncharacterized protein LOC126986140 isoform X2 [Eriocheir sinensis]|uniref:uncharacterized protein LOC126986140 isoform X2 n=1 Tax=Eriocheir sinensis TaxID=95602 RepID=UPI0021C81879|nr:uncharacterized protein LOC126986140 isoform X2 [Eriocheir sinensis]
MQKCVPPAADQQPGTSSGQPKHAKEKPRATGTSESTTTFRKPHERAESKQPKASTDKSFMFEYLMTAVNEVLDENINLIPGATGLSSEIVKNIHKKYEMSGKVKEERTQSQGQGKGYGGQAMGSVEVVRSLKDTGLLPRPTDMPKTPSCLDFLRGTPQDSPTQSDKDMDVGVGWVLGKSSNPTAAVMGSYDIVEHHRAREGMVKDPQCNASEYKNPQVYPTELGPAWFDRVLREGPKRDMASESSHQWFPNPRTPSPVPTSKLVSQCPKSVVVNPLDYLERCMGKSQNQEHSSLPDTRARDGYGDVQGRDVYTRTLVDAPNAKMRGSDTNVPGRDGFTTHSLTDAPNTRGRDGYGGVQGRDGFTTHSLTDAPNTRGRGGYGGVQGRDGYTTHTLTDAPITRGRGGYGGVQGRDGFTTHILTDAPNTRVRGGYGDVQGRDGFTTQPLTDHPDIRGRGGYGGVQGRDSYTTHTLTDVHTHKIHPHHRHVIQSLGEVRLMETEPYGHVRGEIGHAPTNTSYGHSHSWPRDGHGLHQGYGKGHGLVGNAYMLPTTQQDISNIPQGHPMHPSKSIKKTDPVVAFQGGPQQPRPLLNLTDDVFQCYHLGHNTAPPPPPPGPLRQSPKQNRQTKEELRDIFRLTPMDSDSLLTLLEPEGGTAGANTGVSTSQHPHSAPYRHTTADWGARDVSKFTQSHGERRSGVRGMGYGVCGWGGQCAGGIYCGGVCGGRSAPPPHSTAHPPMHTSRWHR